MPDELPQILDPDACVRTFARVVGDGVHSEFEIEHNLNRLVTVEVMEIGSYQHMANVAIAHLDLNRVRVSGWHLEPDPETGAVHPVTYVPPLNGWYVRVVG